MSIKFRQLAFRRKKYLAGFVALLSLVLVVVLTTFVEAQVPRYINYQGKLLDAEDNPVTGEVNITVRIYNTQTGGTALWEETQKVTVTRGIFSLLLGSVKPLDDLDFNETYWYSVEVESDGEMSPRQLLTSVAYAINADRLDGYTAGDFLLASPTDTMVITGGPNKNIELNPTGTGEVIVSIDSSSGDFRVTDGTTNWLLVDSATGNVTIAKDLTVSGTIYGNIASTGGSSTFSTLTVTGASDLRGDISNSTGAVVIADSLTQTGASNQVTFAGNVDANNGLDVTGALTVSGASTFSGTVDINSNIDLDYSGTSPAIDITQSSTGPAAKFSGGRVLIGDDTSNNYALSAGELYVQGDLEVDGTIYGNVSSSGDTSLGATTITTLTVTGPSNLQGNVDVGAGIDITGDANFGGGTTYKVDSSGGATFKTLDITKTDSSTSGTSVTAIIQPTYQDGGVDSNTEAIAMSIAPTINYTGSTKTGNYTALKIAAVETSLPSGTNYLIDARAGSDGTEQKFYIDNSGNVKIFGTLNMNGQRITNLATPVADTDAVTKAYADAIVPVSAGGWTDAGTKVYLTTSTDHVGIGTEDVDAYNLNVGGSINTNSFYIGGSQITASPAELNILDGATLTTSELNILHGISANVTATNLNELTGGGETSLHKHSAESLPSEVSYFGSSIESSEIANGTIMNEDIANDAAIAQSKINLAITDSEVASGANIAWSKISKDGALPSDIGAAAINHTHTAEDLSGVVKTAPSQAQAIQPTQDVVPLTIKGKAGATANVFSIYDAAETPSEKIYVDSAGHMRIAEDTSTGAKNSSATLYFGRNATDDWETFGYDPTLGTKGKFTFSAPLQVEASSPTGITFVEKNAQGQIIQSRDFIYNPETDEFSFSGGTLKHTFQNIIRNPSFESTKPVGWKGLMNNFTAYQVTDAVKKYGEKSLIVKDTDATGNMGIRAPVSTYDKDWERLKGKTITLSFAIKADSNVTTSVGFDTLGTETDSDTNSEIIPEQVNDINVTTDWQNFKVSYNVPTNAVKLNIIFYGAKYTPDPNGGANTYSQNIYIDGVTLVEGNMALEYGPSPIFDTGNQVVYGSLAIGANYDPNTSSNYYEAPRLVFGQPDEYFGGGCGGYDIGSGEIRFIKWDTNPAGTFMINRGIWIRDDYGTAYGATLRVGSNPTPIFALGKGDIYAKGRLELSGKTPDGVNLTGPILSVGVGTVDYANTGVGNAYIAGKLEVDGGIYGDGSNLTGVTGAVQLNPNGAIINDSGLKVNLSSTNPGLAITNNQLDVKLAVAQGLTKTTNGLQVDYDNTTIGINNSNKLALRPSYADGSAYDSRFLKLTGGTMTGPLNFAGGTTYFINGSGAASFASLNLNSGGMINVGAISGATTITATGDLTIDTDKFVVDSDTGNVNMKGTLTQLRSIGLIPMYDNAIIMGDGTDNFGTMTIEYETSETTESVFKSHNAYHWTTLEPTTQDYDIIVRFKLPDGFSSFDSSAPIKIWTKVSDTTGNTKVDVSMKDTIGSPVALNGASSLKGDPDVGNLGKWKEHIITIDTTGKTFTPGGWITLIIKLSADQNDDVYVGELTLRGNW